MVDGCVKALLALFGWLLRFVLTTLRRGTGVAARFGTIARRHSETSVSSGASAFDPEFLAGLGIPAFYAVATGTVSAVRSTFQFPDRPGHPRAPSLQRAHGVASLAFFAQIAGEGTKSFEFPFRGELRCIAATPPGRIEI
jgi:hypothetical protein